MDTKKEILDYLFNQNSGVSFERIATDLHFWSEYELYYNLNMLIADKKIKIENGKYYYKY